MDTLTRCKWMAKALRRALAERHVALPHSACLEIVARQFGRSDWNGLKASCDADVRLALTIFVEHGREDEAALFYAAAFGAESRHRRSGAERPIVALRLGDLDLCVTGANPRREAEPGRGGPFFPKANGAVSIGFVLHVGDADAALRRAIAAGAVLRDRLQVSIDGRRGACVFDPFGYIWSLVETSRAAERRAA